MGEKRKRISRELVYGFLADLALLPILLEPVAAAVVFLTEPSVSAGSID
jgi:hypothetical protein